MQTALFLVFAVYLVATLICVLADILVADREASSAKSEEPNGTRRLRMSREARYVRKTLRHRTRYGTKG